MTDKTALWDKLGKTDPKHTKSFTRGGGFKGTAIKPMWSYRRMTEEFGACGDGWGVGEPTFQTVNGPEGEVLVFCTASIWYGEDRKTVYGVGGDKAVGKNKYGLATDDEAFKKAFTDAITNALKLIGVGADVHMGMFDDSKYVNSLAKEFPDEQPAVNGTAPVRQSQTGRVSAAEMKRGLLAIEQDLLDCPTIADVNKCAKVWAALMERDGWTKDYRDVAAPKFGARREAIKAAEAEEVFPGDLPSGSSGNSYVDNYSAG